MLGCVWVGFFMLVGVGGGIPAIRGVWRDFGDLVDRLLKGDGVLVREVMVRKALLLGMCAPLMCGCQMWGARGKMNLSAFWGLRSFSTEGYSDKCEISCRQLFSFLFLISCRIDFSFAGFTWYNAIPLPYTH